MLSIFEFSQYKQFINAALNLPSRPRGARSRLAKALHCQSSFISKVLMSDGHFTQEQIMLVSEFLELSSVETEYLITMHQLDRAGSAKLRHFYADKLKDLKKKQWSISDRAVKGSALDDETARTYHSAWYFAAIYTAVGIEGFKSIEDIAARLYLPKVTVHSAINFLLKSNIILKHGDTYALGPRRLHLHKESDLTVQNHVNWRLKMVQHLQHEGVGDNVHYSAVLGLSRDAIEPMRELLVNTVKQSELIVSIPGAHHLCVLNLDFVVKD